MKRLSASLVFHSVQHSYVQYMCCVDVCGVRMHMTRHWIGYLLYFQGSDRPVRKDFLWHFGDENVTKHWHWLIVLWPVLVTANLKCHTQTDMNQISAADITLLISESCCSPKQSPTCLLTTISQHCQIFDDSLCLSRNTVSAWQWCGSQSPRSSSKSRPLCQAEDPGWLWTH